MMTCGLWQLFKHASKRDDGAPLSAAGCAAWLVEDAMRGLPPTPRPPGTPGSLRQLYKINQDLELLYSLSLVVLLLLMFVEMPIWCLASGVTVTEPFTYQPPHVSCPAPDGGFIYLSELPYLPVGWGVVVELCCYTIWLIRLSLVFKFEGGSDDWPGRRLFWVKGVATVVAVIDSVVFLAVVLAPGLVPQFRLAPAVRLVHLATYGSMMKLLRLIPRVLPPFSQVLLIYVSIWATMSFVMCLLLQGYDMPIPRCAAEANVTNTSADDCSKVNEGFETFADSFYTIMILSTTYNVPAEQIPPYSEFRSLFGTLFAVTYMMCDIVGLSLILAVVYNAYSSALKDYMMDEYRNRALGLRAAYAALRAEAPEAAGVMYPQLEALMAELNDSVAIAYVPPEHFRYLIRTLDDDDSGCISLREFYDFLDVLNYSFTRFRKKAFLERRFPELYEACGLARLRAFIQRPDSYWSLESIMFGVMLVNAVSIIIECIEQYYGVTEPCCSDTTWGYIDVSFALLYLLNILLNVLVIPFDRYWSKFSNKFDVVVTLVLVVVCILWLDPYVLITSQTIRYFNLLRLLQLSRLTLRSKSFTFIADSFLRILLGSLPILTLLFCATALWTVIGNQALGGWVYGGNPALLDTPLYENNEDVFQFNDFAGPLFIFTSILIEGGPEPDHVEEVALKMGWFFAVLFFMSYVYVVYMIFFNIFISFVIDSFVSRFALMETGGEDGEDKKKLESFYASMDDAEYDVVAQVKMQSASEELSKRMFADEREQIMKSFEADFLHDENLAKGC
jgi:hypothetical protein